MKVFQRWASIWRIFTVLITGGVLAAQDSKPLPAPVSPGQAIQDAAKAAAHDPPQDRPKDGTVETLYSVEGKAGNVEVLTDTRGVNFGPYLKDVVATVRENWYALIPEDAKTKKGKLAIEFAIHQDGSITNLHLAAASGDVSLDRAAWGAITASIPFAAFPSAFTGPYLALRFRFYYNPTKADVDTDAAKPAATGSAAQAKATARVEDAKVLTEIQGFDLRPYLDSQVLPLIGATWYRLASKSGETAGGDATVQFTIRKDGSVADAQLIDGAGHATIGDLALDAVKKSAPFAELPAEFSAPSVTVSSRFEYEPAAQVPPASARDDPSSPSENPCPSKTGDASDATRCVTVNGIAEPVYKVEKGVTVPRITFNSGPEFSEEARKKKIDGVVVLSMVVTSEGNTDQIKVTKSLGHGLDEKAVEAVSKWKFQPATKNGKPVSVEIAVEVDFHLYQRPH